MYFIIVGVNQETEEMLIRDLKDTWKKNTTDYTLPQTLVQNC